MWSAIWYRETDNNKRRDYIVNTVFKANRISKPKPTSKTTARLELKLDLKLNLKP